MYTRNEMLIMLASGAVIGGYLTFYQMARKYNKLVEKHNRVVSKNRIASDIFQEILPQLPDDYDISERTMTNITAFTMFANNDM